MIGFTLIICILLIGAMIFCATKESKLIAVYKVNNVFGRWKAYLAMDFTFAGLFLYISCALAGFIPALRSEGSYEIFGVIGGALLFGAGLYIYYTTYLICPYELRKKVIPDMIICALGISVKIVFFFLPILWKIQLASIPKYEPPKTSKKEVSVYSEDSWGHRTYYKVNSTGDRWQDDSGEWHRIKGV